MAAFSRQSGLITCFQTSQIFKVKFKKKLRLEEAEIKQWMSCFILSYLYFIKSTFFALKKWKHKTLLSFYFMITDHSVKTRLPNKFDILSTLNIYTAGVDLSVSHSGSHVFSLVLILVLGICISICMSYKPQKLLSSLSFLHTFLMSEV